MTLGNEIYNKLEQLSSCSSGNPGVTRLSLSPEHQQALALLEQWMQEAGLETYRDYIGNLIGSYHVSPNKKTLMLGSHQDTVVMGGKYDGALGVVLPIVCARQAIEQGNLGCNLKIVAFTDEEGVRFQTTYLGSMALNGHLDPALMERTDKNGCSLRQAVIDFGGDPQKALNPAETQSPDAYLEIHIEQGPVLEEADLPVGVVTSIQSSYRYEVIIEGTAGHAGTVPMHLRRDPMTSAARIISQLTALCQSYQPLVLTVGELSVTPGAVNVIPSKVRFTIDIRSPKEENILNAMQQAEKIMTQVCAQNHTTFRLIRSNAIPATVCDPHIVDKIKQAVSQSELRVFELASGAGHDAQEMNRVCPVGMLFVRCKEGISHSPYEQVNAEDIDCAAKTVLNFIKSYC